ncbi:MAG: PTS sugar transporter subunit IIA [Candidatus Cloacimonetes bacterium]|nr:PTS sugar transporter subunit IIA [Candidatus Cloacimonadota bacterium]
MWKKIIDRALIVIDPKAETKKELFENMVTHVYNHDYIINQKEFLKALWEREKVSNTELVPGIAYPHARSESVSRLFLCIIISHKGIDYGNPEMGPAKIIFFLGCIPEQAKEYLQVLAKSSRLLKSAEFQEELMNCVSSDEVADLLISKGDEEKDGGNREDFLLILTLFDVGQQSEIMTSLVEAGITNASMVDSTSMARKLAYEMPIFAGLSYMAQGKSKTSRLIFALIDNSTTAHKLAGILKANGIDLSRKGVGFIQTIKIDNIIGNPEENVEL